MIVDPCTVQSEKVEEAIICQQEPFQNQFDFLRNIILVSSQQEINIIMKLGEVEENITKGTIKLWSGRETTGKDFLYWDW